MPILPGFGHCFGKLPLGVGPCLKCGVNRPERRGVLHVDLNRLVLLEPCSQFFSLVQYLLRCSRHCLTQDTSGGRAMGRLAV